MHHYQHNDCIFIISDVHLSSDDDELCKTLEKWLVKNSKKASAIYILGDLFDYWIGDRCALRYENFLNCVRTYSKLCSIYFMSGNRDFLACHDLFSKHGITKISDPFTITHKQKRILLTHGDRLCSRDYAYQWLRLVLQNPLTHIMSKYLPYSITHRVAQRLRETSRCETNKKSSIEMQACELTIQQWLDRYHADAIIYGHVHCLEQKSIPGLSNKTVYVLDSWENQANYCQITGTGIDLISTLPEV